MKTLRKPGKVDKLLEMFPNVGDIWALNTIYSKTGIKNYDTLKAFCSYIRRAEHIPEENRVDLRIKDEKCFRVEV